METDLWIQCKLVSWDLPYLFVEISQYIHKSIQEKLEISKMQNVEDTQGRLSFLPSSPGSEMWICQNQCFFSLLPVLF